MILQERNIIFLSEIAATIKTNAMPTILQECNNEKRNAKRIYRIGKTLPLAKFAAIMKNEMPNDFKTFLINKQNN
jgi:hypothetical protein